MPDLFKSESEASPKTANTNKEEPVGPVIDTLKTQLEKEKVVKHTNYLKEETLIKYPKSEDEKQDLPGHTENPLAAYNYFPSRVDFINKDPQEKIVLFLRKHPITNLKWIITAFLMFVSPAFMSVFPFFETLPENFTILLFLSWYMFTMAYILENFLNWFFSVNIVTDERIFDVDFYNLIYRKITDANIDQIQDVSVQIGGGLRTMFNYGDVLIQTAAEVPEVEFEAVPMPDRVAKVLRELRIEEEVEKLEGRVR